MRQERKKTYLYLSRMLFAITIAKKFEFYSREREWNHARGKGKYFSNIDLFIRRIQRSSFDERILRSSWLQGEKFDIDETLAKMFHRESLIATGRE